MDRLKELIEAKKAAEEVILRVDNSITSMDKAFDWAEIDLWIGGSFFSLIKGARIKDANDDIKEVISALQGLNKELDDVEIKLPEEFSDKEFDYLTDVWFDNFFTDWRIRDEVKEALDNLKEFRDTIIKLIEKLNDEISSCNTEI